MATVRTLNKAKPYMTIHGGEAERLHAFEQNGLRFNPAGECLEDLEQLAAGQLGAVVAAPATQLTPVAAAGSAAGPVGGAGGLSMVSFAGTAVKVPDGQGGMRLATADELATMSTGSVDTGEGATDNAAALLQQAAADRAAALETAARPLLEANAETFIDGLPDVEVELLPVLSRLEAEGKNRKTVIDALALAIGREAQKQATAG